MLVCSIQPKDVTVNDYMMLQNVSPIDKKALGIEDFISYTTAV